MERSYHKSIFAFIDLLASKNEILNDDGSFLTKLGKVYDSTLRIYRDICSSSVRDKMKAKIFSDNIVFECEIESEDDCFVEFKDVAFITSIYQEELLRYNIFCRGGISIGDAYLDDTFVFGRALSEAYLLESKTAIYPRVIISKKLADIVYPITSNSGGCYDYMCTPDKDGEFYVDYLNSPGKGKEDRISLIKKLIEINNAQLKRQDIDSCVKCKLLWHQDYLNMKLSYFSGS